MAVDSGQDVSVAAISLAAELPNDPDVEGAKNLGEGEPEDSASPESGSKTERQKDVSASDQGRALSAGMGAASARSVIHVNVTIDSSLDTEKLEKQLSLLRRFGAI